MFATSPSAPGTPVHSIQTMRRKAAGHGGPLTKILVANRGVGFSTSALVVLCSSRIQEIAIRVFRTAHELAMHTVAIYSYEDRLSAHRQKVTTTSSMFMDKKGLSYLSPMKHIKLAKVLHL